MTRTLTHERLLHLLHYDPVSGEFTWMNPQSKKMRRGDRAGCLTGDGYWRVRVDGVAYRAHRLAVFYVTGQMPPEDVDHKNRSRLENSFSNLRNATRQQNTSNRSLTRRNSSGVVGVHFDKSRNKWAARIKVSGRSINLGRFDDFEQAVRVRKEAEIENFGVFAP